MIGGLTQRSIFNNAQLPLSIQNEWGFAFYSGSCLKQTTRMDLAPCRQIKQLIKKTTPNKKAAYMNKNYNQSQTKSRFEKVVLHDKKKSNCFKSIIHSPNIVNSS